jgi:hypothetical protein
MMPSEDDPLNLSRFPADRDHIFYNSVLCAKYPVILETVKQEAGQFHHLVDSNSAIARQNFAENTYHAREPSAFFILAKPFDFLEKMIQ